MAEAEANHTLPSTTINQPSGKKKRTFLRSILWALFFLTFFATVAFAVYNYALREIAVPLPEMVKEEKQETIVVSESPEFENKEITERAEEMVVVEDLKPDTLKVEIDELTQKLAAVEEQNRNIFIYFLARDLKDAIGDKTAFSAGLQGLRNMIGDNPEVAGKIDILQQSVASDYESATKLREELKLVEKRVALVNRKGFGETVGSAFGELVKVTKVEGDVKAGDYNSIIKRADIALSREKISATELQKIISEVATLGKPAEVWVRKANNLQRIIEVTDYLAEYSKSKVTGI